MQAFSTRGPRFIKFMAVISFTLYPAYISSVVIVGFLFNKSSLNLYFLVVQGLVLYLSLGCDNHIQYDYMQEYLSKRNNRNNILPVKFKMSVGYKYGTFKLNKIREYYPSTTTSMVTTFTFSGRHRQPSRLYNSLGVSEYMYFQNGILGLVKSTTWCVVYR